MSQSHTVADHPKHLAHHFKTMSQQTAAGKMGMWIFMAQEMLFFSGLFCAYAYIYYMFPDMVREAQAHMDWRVGGFNSIVLLVSSLTMSLCVRAARSNNIKLSRRFLLATMGLGLLFLTVKGFEWGLHFQDGLYPGRYFDPSPSAHITDPLAHIYYSIYYVMTGTHGLHIIVGLGLMIWMLLRLNRGDFSSENYVALENTSLFWHLVDIVWIFLYPIVYLAP